MSERCLMCYCTAAVIRCALALALVLLGCGGAVTHEAGSCLVLPADEPEGCASGAVTLYCDGADTLPSGATCARIDAPDGGEDDAGDFGIWCCRREKE
jgi:hypothetical protein